MKKNLRHVLFALCCAATVEAGKLDELPQEIFTMVASHLTIKDLTELNGVSKAGQSHVQGFYDYLSRIKTIKALSTYKAFFKRNTEKPATEELACTIWPNVFQGLSDLIKKKLYEAPVMAEISLHVQTCGLPLKAYEQQIPDALITFYSEKSKTATNMIHLLIYVYRTVLPNEWMFPWSIKHLFKETLSDAVQKIEALETSTESLVLERQELHFIPHAIIRLTALKELNLSDASINAFDPKIFHGLTSLQTLDLSSNLISTIDAATFNGLTSLQTLDLSSNLISTIDAATFQGLSALTKLRLNSNHIKNIDATTFQNLTALRELWLSSNHIKNIDATTFQNLTALRELWLNNNHIKSIDAGTFQSLTSLQSLCLSYNLISSIEARTFQGLETLKWLGLENNKLGTIGPKVFQDLKKLEKLNLNRNKIETIDGDAFQGLEILKWMLLNENKLSAIGPNTFRGLTALEEMNLSKNPLSTIDDAAFQGLTALSFLHLSHTQRNTFSPQVFKGLPALKNLWLDGYYYESDWASDPQYYDETYVAYNKMDPSAEKAMKEALPNVEIYI